MQHHLHESPAVMTLPLVVLAVGAAAGGSIPVPAFLAPVIGHVHEPEAPLAFKLLATALALGGLGLAHVLYVARPELPGAIARGLGGLYALVRDKFRVDELYDATVVRPLFAAADFGAHWFDPRVIDGAVDGTGALVTATSSLWRRLQTGNVQHYALSFLVGALVLLGYYVIR